MANWFEVRAGTMTEAEARVYFGRPTSEAIQPGEIWGAAIKRAYLADVAAARARIIGLKNAAALVPISREGRNNSFSCAMVLSVWWSTDADKFRAGPPRGTGLGRKSPGRCLPKSQEAF